VAADSIHCMRRIFLLSHVQFGTWLPRRAAVVRRALLGMGPAQDADLGAAQAALRDAADPLSRLCYPGPDGEHWPQS
jgi:hypothetical protein